MFSWGNGDHGKLGHGDVIKSAVPKWVEAFGDARVSRVVSYNEHTVAQMGGVAASKPLSCLSEHSLSGDFERLLESSVFADVWFTTSDGRRVPAHRAVLAARCEHFRYSLLSCYVVLMVSDVPRALCAFSVPCLHRE